MATATDERTLVEYISEVSNADPKIALAIALEETKKHQALAQRAAEEYRQMSEVEFDENGCIKSATMGGLWRLARIYADTDLVPDQYKRKPANCFLALQLAFRWKADPIMVMQNTYVVHGRPGIEGKLVAALLNCSGKIKGKIKYEITGSLQTKDYCCRAWAIDAESDEEVEAVVDWAMIDGEKWAEPTVTKSGARLPSKWETMPRVMGTYRASTFLVRLHYPELLMGMRTADEQEDIEKAERLRLPAKRLESIDDLADAMEGEVVQAQGNGQPEKQAEPETKTEQPQTEGEAPKQEKQPEKPAGDSDNPKTWRDHPDLPTSALVAIESAVSHAQLDRIAKKYEAELADSENGNAVAAAIVGRRVELDESQAQTQAKKKQKNLVD
jgi:hypothetical protein